MTDIVHFTTVHPAQDTRILLKECTYLAKNGFHTKLIANGDSKIINDVEIIGINIPKNRFLRATVGSIKMLIRCLHTKGDLYHFHDPELLVVGLILKLCGKRVVYDAHEDVPSDILSKQWIPKVVRPAIAFFFTLLQNFIAKKLDCIITATPFIKKSFSQITTCSVEINNYPLLQEFVTTPEIKKKKTQICYIGAIDKLRGAEEMIEAAKKADVPLILGGGFSPNLQEYCQKLSGWSNVKYFGYLSRAKVTNIMQESLVGLVLFYPEPNHINAQPNKMFEYMAAGLPIIVSDFPLWRLMINKYLCGICVAPLNIAAIADAIIYLKQHPKIAADMGKNGRAAILQELNWETEGKKLIEVYNSIIATN